MTHHLMLQAKAVCAVCCMAAAWLAGGDAKPSVRCAGAADGGGVGGVHARGQPAAARRQRHLPHPPPGPGCADPLPCSSAALQPNCPATLQEPRRRGAASLVYLARVWCTAATLLCSPADRRPAQQMCRAAAAFNCVICISCNISAERNVTPAARRSAQAGSRRSPSARRRRWGALTSSSAAGTSAPRTWPSAARRRTAPPSAWARGSSARRAAGPDSTQTPQCSRRHMGVDVTH